MLGKQKSYIISPSQVSPSDVELVGTRAISIQHISNLGILVPDYFVISSVSFDDFIIASGLVDKISASIAKLNSEDPGSAEKVSDEVTSMLAQAVFPSTVLHPIIQAYNSMCGISDKYVELTPSYIYTDDLVPAEDSEFVFTNVKGEAALLYSVKQVWARLFSKESLMHRFSKGYRSGLSVAIVVRKAIQAESSGVGYSLDPIGGNKDSILIEALLGLRNEHNANETYDVYRLDAQDARIVEKNISSQEKMYVRRAKIEDPSRAYLTVPISPDWRRRQKLDDHFIVEIGQKIKKLEKDLHSDIEIEWTYEVGKVFVMSVKKYEELDMHTLSPQLPQPQLNPDLEVVRSTTQSDSEELSMPVVTPFDSPRPQLKLRPKLDIKKLVTEVNDIVDGKIEIPTTETVEESDMEQPEQSGATLNSGQDFKEEYKLITNMYLDVSALDTEVLVEANKFDGIYVDGTELVRRHQVFPENAGDKFEVGKLIESYALDISTVTRAAGSKPVLFAFSDLPSQDKPGGLDGAERFISHPEALITEVLANRKANSIYESKSLSYIVPKPRTLNEIADVKKILASQNIRRTKTSLLHADISLPIFGYQLADVDTSLVDGIIINLPKLLPQLLGSNKISAAKFGHSLGFLENICLTAKSKGLVVSIKLGSMEHIDLEKILSLGADNLIFSEIPDSQTLGMVQSKDQQKSSDLTPAKTRGRKIKPL